MQGKFLIIIGVLITTLSSAQVESSIRKHDFGEIERSTDRVVDIQFTNHGDTEAFVLRTKVEFYYNTLWSARSVAPDSTITLRLKVNPREKGGLNDQVDVYFSSMQEPISIRIKGEVNFIDRSENPACPSFRERPDDCCGDDPFMVKVIDQKTRKPIKDARVRLVQQGVLQRDVLTDREGIYSENVPISFYLLIASAEGYSSADTSSYINRRNNYFELELLPDEEVEVEIEEEIEVEVEVEVEVEEEEEVMVPAPVPVEVTSADLPEDRYTRNSVVFLVDVSQSMNQKGKLDLLKASMLEMISILRPIDQVALISYASKSVVVFDMTAADRKGEMKRAIRELQAGGMTSGAKGFKEAFEMARNEFIEDGNNEVIVATDGAFTKRDKPQILKMVDKNRKKNVKTTVVGIRSTDYASENLMEIAEVGNGSFIRIEDYDQALSSLVEEIKKQSFIQR